MSENKLYQLSTKEVFSILNSSPKGLSSSEAGSRSEKYGKNELVTSKSVSPIIKFLAQFKDVFMIVLLVAAGLSFFIKSYRDGIIMLIIAIINAVIGFMQ